MIVGVDQARRDVASLGVDDMCPFWSSDASADLLDFSVDD